MCSLPSGTDLVKANGAVAIVLQDESYRINLAISYSNSKPFLIRLYNMTNFTRSNLQR